MPLLARRPFAVLAVVLGLVAGFAADGVRRSAPAGAVVDCGQYYRLPSNTCTHGSDPAPAGVNIFADVPPYTQSQLDAAGAASCSGDGTSGKRIEVIYAYPAGTTSRYSTYLSTFRALAAKVETIVRNSAAQTTGTRAVNWVTSGCQVVVRQEQVPAAAAVQDAPGTCCAAWTAMRNALVTAGYTSTDRKYLVFMDANVYCGLGEVAGDDSADPATNAHNGNGSPGFFARVDNGCWGDGHAAAHEVGHTLGAVQDSAPHSTGAGHCYDDWDVMCYDDDGPGVYPTPGTYCSSTANDNILDCNHDDYFSTKPTIGSYLAGHWNTADSDFLTKPSWHGPEALSGGLSSGVDVVAEGVRKLDVVLYGQNVPTPHVYIKSYDSATSWGSFRDLGAPSAGLMAGTDPSVSSWAEGRLDLFVLGADQHVYHRFSTDGGATFSTIWEDLGGNLASSPDAVSMRSGRVDVFALGPNGALYQKYYPATSSGGWSTWASLGTPTDGNLTSAPSAASWGDNRLDVFARGQNDTLRHRWYSGPSVGWSAWETLPYTMSGGPDATSWGSGRYDVFWRGAGDNVYRISYERNVFGWTSPSQLPATTTFDPGAAAWTYDRLDLFYRRSDGQLGHMYYSL